jgi:hypothetical protein
MKKKIIYTALILSFFSDLGLANPSRTQVETQICKSLEEFRVSEYTPSLILLSLLPSQGSGHFSNIINWSNYFNENYSNQFPEYSELSSCAITNWSDNTFELSFIFYEINKYKDESIWNKVDADVKCLFSSNYEWECLYQASIFDIRYYHKFTHPQQMGMEFDSHMDTVFEKPWQTQYLNVILNETTEFL